MLWEALLAAQRMAEAVAAADAHHRLHLQAAALAAWQRYSAQRAARRAAVAGQVYPAGIGADGLAHALHAYAFVCAACVSATAPHCRRPPQVRSAQRQLRRLTLQATFRRWGAACRARQAAAVADEQCGKGVAHGTAVVAFTAQGGLCRAAGPPDFSAFLPRPRKPLCAPRCVLCPRVNLSQPGMVGLHQWFWVDTGAPPLQRPTNNCPPDSRVATVATVCSRWVGPLSGTERWALRGGWQRWRAAVRRAGQQATGLAVARGFRFPPGPPGPPFCQRPCAALCTAPNHTGIACLGANCLYFSKK